MRGLRRQDRARWPETVFIGGGQADLDPPVIGANLGGGEHRRGIGAQREPFDQLQPRLQGILLRIEHLDDVGTALIELGRVLGTPARAQAAAQDYQQRLAALRLRHADAPPVRVLYQIETAPVYSINRMSPISEAITANTARPIWNGVPADTSTPCGTPE